MTYCPSLRRLPAFALEKNIEKNNDDDDDDDIADVYSKALDQDSNGEDIVYSYKEDPHKSRNRREVIVSPEPAKPFMPLSNTTTPPPQDNFSNSIWTVLI